MILQGPTRGRYFPGTSILQSFKANFKRVESKSLPATVYLQRILPGGDACRSKVGESWGESCSPICREKRGCLRRGVKVEQTIGKDTRRLHRRRREKQGGQFLFSLYISQQLYQSIEKKLSLVHQIQDNENISEHFYSMLQRSCRKHIITRQTETYSSCRNDPARCDERFGLLHWWQLEHTQWNDVTVIVCHINSDSCQHPLMTSEM